MASPATALAATADPAAATIIAPLGTAAAATSPTAQPTAAHVTAAGNASNLPFAWQDSLTAAEEEEMNLIN